MKIRIKEYWNKLKAEYENKYKEKILKIMNKQYLFLKDLEIF